jgi:hypothetical protein
MFSTSDKTVGLTRPRKDIGFAPAPELLQIPGQRIPITVIGQLDYATIRGKDVVGLTTENGEPFEILVKEGMEDLVKSYFTQWVTVTGSSDGKYIYLDDIQACE